jgi:hypothetical protein
VQGQLESPHLSLCSVVVQASVAQARELHSVALALVRVSDV